MIAEKKYNARRSGVTPERIEAWVAKHFHNYRQRRKGEELTICCPFDGDSDYKFNISLDKGLCHYWRGDHWAPTNKKTGKRSTTFVSFVMTYKGCTYSAAVKEITGQKHSVVLRDQPEEELEEAPALVELPEGAVPIDGSPFPTSARAARNWLKGRGVGPDLVTKYQLMHTASGDVVWPYYEYDYLVYWQKRSILQKIFLFPPKEVADKDFFFGFDLVQQGSYLIVTEGIIDAMSISTQAVASGGASLSTHQARRIRLLSPDAIILAPDNDAPGVFSLMHNAPLLQGMGFKVYFSIPPRIEYEPGKECKDWNDLLLEACGGERSGVESILEKGLRLATTEAVASAVLSVK